jgi:hypothetical protein
MSPELEILRAPARAYARLSAGVVPVRAVDAWHRPVVAALTIGTAASMSSTGHVSVALVASVTACWSFFVGIQLLAAWMVIPAGPRRRLGTARTIDLFFAGQAPWLLWLLAFAAWALVAPPLARDVRWMLAAMVVPLSWNVAIVHAFFRAALQLSPAEARRRTIAHQAITLGAAFVIFANAVALWPRVVGLWTR